MPWLYFDRTSVKVSVTELPSLRTHDGSGDDWPLPGRPSHEISIEPGRQLDGRIPLSTFCRALDVKALGGRDLLVTWCFRFGFSRRDRGWVFGSFRIVDGRVLESQARSSD